jgi:hypothetical protein
MNTSAQALVFAVATVTAAVGIGSGLADWTAQTAPEVVQLEKVVVVAKRADTLAATEVVMLPRVVVEGRRAPATDDVQVAANRPQAAAL